MVNRQEIMGCESVDMVRFDLGTLLQGQMRTAKLKSAYNSFIIGPRGFGMVNHRKSWAGNVFVWLDLTLDPFFKVERGYCICSISLNMF